MYWKSRNVGFNSGEYGGNLTIEIFSRISNVFELCQDVPSAINSICDYYLKTTLLRMNSYNQKLYLAQSN